VLECFARFIRGALLFLFHVGILQMTFQWLLTIYTRSCSCSLTVQLLNMQRSKDRTTERGTGAGAGFASAIAACFFLDESEIVHIDMPNIRLTLVVRLSPVQV
jgi:hypothetical protein